MPDAPHSRPAPLAIPDEVMLLVDVLEGRSNGSNDFQAGTSDEDLLYALEEALPLLERMKKGLETNA